ncbi:MAG: FAD:protein FMN transferase [Nostocoides sp.]
MIALAEPATPPVIDAGRAGAQWRALGTDVEVRTDPDHIDAACELVVDALAHVDLACSRFRPDSEVRLLAARAGGRHTVSPVLQAALRVALEAADETDGLIDPTMGSLIEAAGYDRTFRLVPASDTTPVILPRKHASWRDIAIDTPGTVTLPDGVLLDLGATGKAFAADLAAQAVATHLATAVLVGVGGDLRVVTPPGVLGPRYPVRLGDRRADVLAPPQDAPVVELTAGGLATSSVTARRWTRSGRRWHHLFDPRTGLPTAGPWRTVTAYGHCAAAANAASSAAIILGEQALSWLTERDVAARLVAHTGEITLTPAWSATVPTAHRFGA